MLYPADKAAVYADLGLTLTYKPSDRLVLADACPVYVARVGGGLGLRRDVIRLRESGLSACRSSPATRNHSSSLCYPLR